jgi:hypothetical protein
MEAADFSELLVPSPKKYDVMSHGHNFLILRLFYVTFTKDSQSQLFTVISK